MYLPTRACTSDPYKERDREKNPHQLVQRVQWHRVKGGSVCVGGGALRQALDKINNGSLLNLFVA